MKKAKLKFYIIPCSKKILKKLGVLQTRYRCLKKNFSVKQINSFFQFLKFY